MRSFLNIILDNGLSYSDISDITGMKRSKVIYLVKRLESMGLISITNFDVFNLVGSRSSKSINIYQKLI